MPFKTKFQEQFGDVEFSWKPVEPKYDLNIPGPGEVPEGGTHTVPDPEEGSLPSEAGLWPFVDMPVDEFLM